MPRDQSHRLASSGWIDEMQSNSAAVDVRRALADAEAALDAAEELAERRNRRAARLRDRVTARNPGLREGAH
jgi:hypothetical protein